MTEPTTQTPAEGEQQPEAADPTPAPATADPSAGQDVSVDWESRYKGVMTVLNQKNAELEQARTDAGTAASTIEQMQRDAEALRAEMDTKIAALTEQLGAITGERDEAVAAADHLLQRAGPHFLSGTSGSEPSK